MTVSGSQNQMDAAVKALQNLRETEVPAFERGFISDALLQSVAGIVLDAPDANTAFTDLQKYRAQEVPWFEQGAVTDDVLRTLVSTVLDAVKDVT